MGMAGFLETVNTVALIFFIAGIVLLTVEMFLPGIGIFGGLGFSCLVLCIVFHAKTLAEALILVLVIAAIIAVFALILVHSFKKGRIYRSGIVLKNAQTREEGFVAGSDMSRFAGKAGVSATVLRPAGAAVFDGERIDVLTEGEFVPSGTPITVVRVEGSRVFVKKAER
jgi:membrane-bound ClpP family serine protease